MQRTIELRGGEKKIEQLTLTSLSEVEKQEISNRERIEKSPYIFGIALSVHDSTHQTSGDLSTVGIDLNFEKKFFNLFGLRAQASLLNAEETDTSGDKSPRTVEGSQYSVALPVYLTSSIYIGPIRSTTKQTVSCKSTFGNCQDYHITQSSSGWIIGYQGSWKDDNGIDLNYNNQKFSDDRGFSGLSASTWTLSFCHRF
jgi:hypothetical protein